jgi:hypothetical protein
MMKKFIPALYLLTSGVVFGADFDWPLEVPPAQTTDSRRGEHGFNSGSHNNARTSSYDASSYGYGYCYGYSQLLLPALQKPKEKLTYEVFSGPFTQDESDAATILFRFTPNFLDKTADFNKLSCKKFSEKVIGIYRENVQAFYTSIDDVAVDMLGRTYKRIENPKELRRMASWNEAPLPSYKEKEISKAIQEYLETITF